MLPESPIGLLDCALCQPQERPLLRYQIHPVTHFQQNCSLIWCEHTREAALIDPGGEPERLIAAVDAAGVTLTRILLTHGHLDHVGAATELARHYNVPIIGPHRDDDFWLELLDDQARMLGFDPVPAVLPDRFLEDGERLSLGQLNLDVHHCPGHTPGHIVLVDQGSRLAFVGDVLFHGAIGRTDFPRGNYDHLIGAIRSKLWPLGDDITFIPGHGPSSTFGAERAHNPFVADSRFG